MKKALVLALAICSASPVFEACTKQDAQKVVTNALSSSFSANVAGAAWSADAVTATSKAGVILVSAVKTDGTNMTLSIPAGTKPGTYPGGVTTAFNIAYDKDQSTVYAASTDTFIITACDTTTVTGTFHGTMSNAKNSADIVNVTNGSFTAKF